MSSSLASLFERLTLRITGNLALFISVFISVNAAIVTAIWLVENPLWLERRFPLGWESPLTWISQISAFVAISSLLVSLVGRQLFTLRNKESSAKCKPQWHMTEEPPEERSSLGFDRLLLDTIRAIEAAPDFDGALEATLKQIAQSAQWDYAEAWMPSADAQALQSHPAYYIRSGIGSTQPVRLPLSLQTAIEEFRRYSEGLTFLPGEGLPGQVWQQLQPEWIEHLSAEPTRVYLREHLAQQCRFNRVLGIPLCGKVESDRATPIAILVFFKIDPHPDDRELVRFWTQAGPQLGTIVAQKSYYDQFQAYLAATTDVMFAIDSQGYCLKIAPTRTHQAYRAAHPAVGRSLQDSFAPDLARTFIDYIWQALRTKETVNIEYSLTIRARQSDCIVWFSAAISPISEETVMWIARDITDRKQVERALQEQKTYLRLVLDNIPQQVFWKDTNLIFRGCNKNWAKSAHLKDAEDAVGKTDYDLLPSREMADFFRDRDRQVLESDTAQLHVIVSKQRPDESGKVIWLDVSRIPMHDAQGKIIGVLGVLEDITQRREAEEALRQEQAKSERLLLNVLPKEIANQLKEHEGAIASSVDDATVLFADIVGFTSLSARLSARELVNLLNQIFSEFDRLAESHRLEKIKTIGDAYMVAGGIPVPRPDGAQAVAQMALDMQRVIERFKTDRGETFQIRIGINTGSVVAGVIGIKKFIYDLWGDTVNVASRMESTGVPGGIQVTQATYERLSQQYRFKARGQVEIKGKGEMQTYWLIDRKIL
ncbi:MAG: adenylate/guanylate cyclase domain-containing protein [Cyanobacteriota bacterium]|nr:adenylate/guanylate cyclase domain-containing protein [Cyanobacteriota bacterium]